MLLTSFFLLESWAFVFKINLISMCSLNYVCHSKGLFMLQIWISHSSGSQMCKLKILFANWKLKSGPISDNRSKLAIVLGIQLLYSKAHTFLAGGGIAKSKVYASHTVSPSMWMFRALQMPVYCPDMRSMFWLNSVGYSSFLQALRDNFCYHRAYHTH